MRTGRPPMEIGTWGHICRTLLAPGRWVASCWVRDTDGVTRRARRRTPQGATDPKGAAAERALIRHLKDRVPPNGGAITPETTVAELWTSYRQHLVDRKRSHNTVQRNDTNAKHIRNGLGGVRMREMQTQRAEDFIRTVEKENGAAAAKSVRTTLSGMMGMAVRYGALAVNPVRETLPADTGGRKPARSLESDEAKAILHGLTLSTVPCPPIRTGKDGTTHQPRYRVPTAAEYCHKHDIVDVIWGFAGTGLRASELFGLLWEDFDAEKKTIKVTGKVIRVKGRGMVRVTEENHKNIHREIALPHVLVVRLLRRQQTQPKNEMGLIFPSEVGTIMDPTNFNDQWRRVRRALGFDFDFEVTGHTFRKTLITIGDDAGISAVALADHAGHAETSMTQNTYMGRKRVRYEVAAALDAAFTDIAHEGIDGKSCAR